jgi:hypothetical protein
MKKMTPKKIKELGRLARTGRLDLYFLMLFTELLRMAAIKPIRLGPAPGLKGRDRNKRCIFSGRKLKHLHPRTLEHLYGIAQA